MEVEVFAVQGDHKDDENDSTRYGTRGLAEDSSSISALQHIPIKKDVLKKMEVADLQKELKLRSLTLTGNKAVLSARLQK